MMTIGSANGAALQKGNGSIQTGYSAMNGQADAYSKGIQNQIANAQRQLQELSSNENMTSEEKMKKRQEIQQQINELNMQLRQHQMEQRMEERTAKRQTKGSPVEELLGGTGNRKTGRKGTGISQASMAAIISADSSIKQAKIQGNVATKMEGKAAVLESEIKMDEALGGDAKGKKEELAKVEQMAAKATASQMETLGDANEAIEEAAKAEGDADKGPDTKTDAAVNGSTKKDNKKTDNKKTNSAIKDNAIKENKKTDVSAPADIPATEQKKAGYVSVDIRL